MRQELLVLGIALAACVDCRGVRRNERSIFERVSGTWGWTNKDGSCEVNPHRISFAADRRTMTITYTSPVDGPPGRAAVWRYEVRASTAKLIRVALVDPPENRLTKTGEPVLWDLFLVEEDT